MSQPDYDNLFSKLDEDLRKVNSDISLKDIQDSAALIAQALQVYLDLEYDDIEKLDKFSAAYMDNIPKMLSTTELDSSEQDNLTKVYLFIDACLWSAFSGKLSPDLILVLLDFVSKSIPVVQRMAYSAGHRAGYKQGQADSAVDDLFDGWDIDIEGLDES